MEQSRIDILDSGQTVKWQLNNGGREWLGTSGHMVGGMQDASDFYAVINDGFKNGNANINAQGFTHDGKPVEINNIEQLISYMRDPNTPQYHKQFIIDNIKQYFKDLGNKIFYINYGKGRNWTIPESHIQYFTVPRLKPTAQKSGGKLKKIYL